MCLFISMNDMFITLFIKKEIVTKFDRNKIVR